MIYLNKKGERRVQFDYIALSFFPPLPELTRRNFFPSLLLAQLNPIAKSVDPNLDWCLAAEIARIKK